MNNQTMDGSMQGAAMTNALTGERTHRTVSFATTGDAELDLISGFVALAGNLPGGFGPDVVSRVLRYLLNRYEDMAKNQSGTIASYCSPPPPFSSPPPSIPDANHMNHLLEEILKGKHRLE